MTEAEWLACTDPQPMLEFLRGKASDRKLRLFALACCHRIRHLLDDKRTRSALGAVELAAEGLSSIGGVLVLPSPRPLPHTVYDSARNTAAYYATAAVDAAQHIDLHMGCIGAASNAAAAIGFSAQPALRTTGQIEQCREAQVAESVTQAALLRCIFGNPYRQHHPLSAAIVTSDGGSLRSIAEAIYDDRAFDRLPTLASALLDAACDEAALIQHCRSEGPHVPGCWALDLILGKS